MNKKRVSTNDYTFYFSSISNTNGTIRFINHSKNEENTVILTVNDKDFQQRVWQEFPSVIADLIDLAIAIHASDRLACQNLSQEQSHIFVVLPVRHPELLSNGSFQAKLEGLLEWTTGSRWFFDFKKRTTSGRIVEQQQVIPMSLEGYEVALWSGGLDALAGLYTRLKTSDKVPFMLFGTGSNDNVYNRQKNVFTALQPYFPNRLNLCRVPIRFTESELIHKNSLYRTRGILFTFLGVACAYLMGQKKLFVYENGVGAINLPYRASAIGLDHSRSVHPLTLLKVSEVVSGILGEKFEILNPFIFWTKAKMCEALAEDKGNDLVEQTQSCDSPHRQRPGQCGYCSSCLLRRQAIAAVNMEDKTRYVVPHGKRPVEDPSLYLRNMLEQVSTFRNLLSVSDIPNLQWRSLTRKFPVLDDIVDRNATVDNIPSVEMQKHLIHLYQAYVAEWDAVKSRIAVGLLEDKTIQQASNQSLVVVQ